MTLEQQLTNKQTMKTDAVRKRIREEKENNDG